MFCALHIPDFPAAAIIRAEPDLRGCAVAVLEGTPPLLRVAAMNEDARCQGVEPGMMKLEAEALPDLALRRRSSAAEAAAEAALLDCAHGFSPRVEPLAPDTVLLDAAGLERLFGPPPQLAKEIVARAGALGIEPNVAVAHNREAAIHAARGFPGVTIIPCGQEARQLGDLPVDVLFAGPDASGLPNCRPLPQQAKTGLAGDPAAELPNLQTAEITSDGRSALAAEARGSRRSHRKPREYREAPNFDDQKTAAQFGSSAVRQFGSWVVGTLDRWGVHNLRAFAALPTVAVAERLGQEGVRLQKMARGEGSTDLVPAEPPLHFVESMELEHPVDLLEPLAFIFARLLEQLCARLEARALATNELRLALTLDSAVRDEETEPSPQRRGDAERLPNCRTAELPNLSPGNLSERHDFSRAAKGALKNCHPERTSVREGSTFQFGNSAIRQFGSVLRLPTPMLDARLFLKLLQLDLKQHPPGAPVLKVELAAEPVRPQVAQHGLFQAASPEPEKLHLMLARLAAIVGQGNVGSPELLNTHRRDAFVVKPFAPESSLVVGRRSLARNSTAHQLSEGHGFSRAVEQQKDNRALAPEAETPSTAIRILRPPLAAQVTVRDQQPVRVVCEGDGSRAPVAGDVMWASGPWRASGDWWTQTAAAHREACETRYTREEWDIAIATTEGDVLCRLVHDLEEGTWLLEGMYD